MFRIAAIHVFAVAATALATGLLALTLLAPPLFALNAAFWSFVILMTVTTPGLVVPMGCLSLLLREREDHPPHLLVLLYGVGTMGSVAGAAAALSLDGRGLLVFLLPAVQTLFAAIADVCFGERLAGIRLNVADEGAERSETLPVAAFAR